MDPLREWWASAVAAIAWLIADLGRFFRHLRESRDIAETALGGQPQDSLYFLAFTLGIGILGYLGYVLIDPIARLIDMVFRSLFWAMDRLASAIAFIAEHLPWAGARFGRLHRLQPLWEALLESDPDSIVDRWSVWKEWASAPGQVPAGAPSDWLTPLIREGLIGTELDHLLEAGSRDPALVLKSFESVRAPIDPAREEMWRSGIGVDGLILARRIQLAFLREWYGRLGQRPADWRARLALIREMERLLAREKATLLQSTDFGDRPFWQREIDLYSRWLAEMAFRDQVRARQVIGSG